MMDQKKYRTRIFQKEIIGPIEDPYMVRYILFANGHFGIYLHHIIRSDNARALHDHPWNFRSLILKGAYTEVAEHWGGHSIQPTVRALARSYGPRIQGHTVGSEASSNGRFTFTDYYPFALLIRAAEWKHRIEIIKPVWSLVFNGRRRRDWGFYPDGKFVHWKEYHEANNP